MKYDAIYIMCKGEKNESMKQEGNSDHLGLGTGMLVTREGFYGTGHDDGVMFGDWLHESDHLGKVYVFFHDLFLFDILCKFSFNKVPFRESLT